MLNRQNSASAREKRGTENLVWSVLWIKRLSAITGLRRK